MLAKSPLKDLDRCVYCGLCLPHCPSYGVSRQEGDSPRGRIALMQGLEQGTLAVNDKLLKHFDRCLGCHACEAMCPSEVPFTRLMDAARTQVQPQRPASRLSRKLRQFGFSLLRKPRRLRTAGVLLRLYQNTGLQWLTRRSGILHGTLALWEQTLPRLKAPLAARRYAASAASPATHGRVQLFTGCIASLADTRTQKDCLKILTALGYEVEISQGQTCCGALQQHNGAADQAGELAMINAQAFRQRNNSPIISSVSGCSAHLQQYENLYAGTSAGEMGIRVSDITHFIASRQWPARLQFRPLPEVVAVQDPCTLRHALKGHEAVYELLRQVPQLELVNLNPDGGCCGAAGNYFLTQPEMAQAIRSPHIERLKSLGVQTLVSSNLGCALHLAAGAREAGLALEVIHPVTLLARQLV